MARSEKKQLSRVKDYHITFGTEHGKRVLDDMAVAHHLINTCVVHGDDNQTIRNEGERNVILRILTLLDKSPAEILEMIKNRERDQDHGE